MVADVITLAFQLSLISVAAVVVIGLIRDELADRASAVGHTPALFPEVDAPRAAVNAVGSKARVVRRQSHSPRAQGVVRSTGASRRELARTSR